jgi:hypothetical protein
MAGTLSGIFVECAAHLFTAEFAAWYCDTPETAGLEFGDDTVVETAAAGIMDEDGGARDGFVAWPVPSWLSGDLGLMCVSVRTGDAQWTFLLRFLERFFESADGSGERRARARPESGDCGGDAK